MNLKEIHRVYFVGIGGIGMSALARYFVAQEKQVAGYDKAPSKITEVLFDLGISIHFDDAITNVPSSFLDSKGTLIVYTPAVPKNHSELNYFLEHGFWL